MRRSLVLKIIAINAIVAAIAVLAALAATLWPPDLVTGLLLAALLFLPLIALLALLESRHRHIAPWKLSTEDVATLSADELVQHKLDLLSDFERRLEFRELRLARQIRTSQLSSPDFVDLRQSDPSDEELGLLVQNDQKLVALIEAESQLAFNRILQNRYASDNDVNTALILQDIRDFIERVAQLYRPESEHILLETEIELVAKSLSSVSLHLLLVVDDLPLNLKSYNTAKMYRLIRSSTKYYGNYKAFQPYLEHGLNAVQIARLALGVNPIAVGTAWLAGKLSSHGARVVGERLVQRKALQLLNDFIRVIGFEAAMMYGGDFAHRDANWVFGAELVNLEVCRGDDFAGRDAALKTLCSLVLRNEFDRIHLLTRLARGKRIDTERLQPRIIMTAKEREGIARLLEQHCLATNVSLERQPLRDWVQNVEQYLHYKFETLHEAVPHEPGNKRPPSRLKRFRTWVRSLRPARR